MESFSPGTCGDGAPCTGTTWLMLPAVLKTVGFHKFLKDEIASYLMRKACTPCAASLHLRLKKHN